MPPRELSAEEAAALGLAPPPAPAAPAARELSPDEARALGISAPAPTPAAPAAPAEKPYSVIDDLKAAPGVMWDQLKAAGRGLEQVNPFSDEMKGGIAAGVRAVGNVATGKPIGENVAADYRAVRDEDRAANETAAREHPGAYYPATIAGAVALPGLGTVVKGAGMGAQAARAGLGVVEGAGMGLGASTADLTKGDTAGAVRDMKAGAAVPAVAGTLGLGVGAAAKGIRKAVEKVAGAGDPDVSLTERALNHVMTRRIKAGASPSEAKRAFGTSPNAVANTVDLVQRTPALRSAIKAGDQEKMVEAADGVLSSLRGQTAPIYQKVDKELGDIDPKLLTGIIDDEINKLYTPKNIASSRARVESLKELRDHIDTLSVQGSKGISTQDLRDFTTGLLKQKNAVVGGIAETPGYTYRRDNHALFDGYLNRRLDVAAKMSPELAEDVARLRDVNRDIAAAINISSVAGDAVANKATRMKGIDEQIGGAVRSAAPSAGAAMAALGSGAGLSTGLAAAVAAPAAKWATKEALFAMGTYARNVRLGKAKPSDLEAAIKAGVPTAILRGISRNMVSKPDQSTEAEQQ